MKEELTVFEEWMHGYSKDIERLAFQYGCSAEQAARLTEETFSEMYNDAEKMAEGKLAVYKMLLERLGHIEQLTSESVNPIPFEEDVEFHLEIVKLAEPYRVPFILQEFHELSVEEIAAITTLTPAEVEANSLVALQSLGKSIGHPAVEVVRKRLEFLRKSYDRLPVLFTAGNVRGEESGPIVSVHKKWSRKRWITTAILSVLVAILVGSTYFTGEDWELRADRKYIEGLEKDFAVLAAEKQGILGVSDAAFNRMTYFRSNQEYFQELMGEFKDKNQDGEKIDRQLGEDRLLEVTEAMKLPSELADELFATPLVNDAEKSMLFAEGYFMKVDAVRYSLYELYGNDYNRLSEALKTESFDAEAMVTQRDGYSQDTVEAIQALASQSIGPVLTEQALGHNDFVAQLRAALHESAGSLLTRYEREPFMMNNKLVYSLDETIEFIVEMEETLIASKENGWVGHSVEGTLLNLMDAILQGETIEEFENNDGSIGEVHRNAWKRLALLGPDSAVGTIMTKIVGEMEASGWKHSAFLDLFGNWGIQEAYFYAANGDLEKFGEKPLREMYTEMIFVLPNNDLDNSVVGLYDAFSVAYDRAVLKNVHPLFIVGLFYYANDKGDSTMMWHLTDPASRISSASEYDAKEISLLNMTDSIRFNPSMIMATTGAQTTVPIEFERNGKMYYNVWMTYAEDNVWQLESIVIEEGSLEN